MTPVHQKCKPSWAPKGRLLPKIAEWCRIVASLAPWWLTRWFIQSLLWMIGPSKLSSIICRWDDEPSFILIQVFIAVIRGKDHLPVTQRGYLSLQTYMHTVYMFISYHSECPICGVCLTSTRPCWRHPVHSLVTPLSSFPRAPHQDRTRIHIPLTLKVMTADACGEQGYNLLIRHL